MALLRRRERRPGQLAGLLDEHERVLSWADTSTGAQVVATSLGLWWPDVAGPRRIRWEHVDKAVWRDAELTVVEAEVADDLLLVDRPAVSVELTVPRDLPPTVRKRVESNIVRTELVAVPGGAVRFVARRRVGHDGVTWWARLEPGTPDTESLRAAVGARLERLRGRV